MHNNVSLLYCTTASGLDPHLYLKGEFALLLTLSYRCLLYPRGLEAKGWL